MKVVMGVFLLCLFFNSGLQAMENEFFLELDMSWNLSWQDDTNFYAYTENESFLSGIGGGIGYRSSFDLTYIHLGVLLSYHQKSEDIVRSSGSLSDEFSIQLESTHIGSFLKIPLWQGVSLYTEYKPSVSSKVKKQNSSSYSPFVVGDQLSGVSSGFGVYMYWQNHISVSGIYRQTIYKDIILSGSTSSLPNSQYDRLAIDEFVVQMGYWF